MYTFTSVQPSESKFFNAENDSRQVTIRRSDFPKVGDATVEVTEYREGLAPKKVENFTWSNPAVKVRVDEQKGRDCFT